MGATRTLLLIRHAHASPARGGGDHERELSPRGRDEAQRAGLWIAEQGLGPTKIAHSDSTRTTQTARLLASSAGSTCELLPLAELYCAGPGQLEATMASEGLENLCLAIVAHNPGMYTFANQLALRCGGVVSGFAPATIAVYEFDHAWDLGATGVSRRAGFWSPSGA